MKHIAQNFEPNYSLLTWQRTSAASLQFKAAAAVAITLIFAAVDFMVLRSMTNLIFTDSPSMITATALVAALILDVPMAIVGSVWKHCKAGMCSRRSGAFLSIVCLSAFLLMFSLCAVLRIVMRDVLFSDVGLLQTGLLDFSASAADAQPDNTAAVWGCAIFMALFPLATSLASLAIGYHFSDPIAARLNVLYQKRTNLQDTLTQVDAALEECGDLEAEVLQAQQCEEELYQQFLASIDVQASELKQKARLLLMEKLNDPDSITLLTKRAQALCQGPLSVPPALLQPQATELPESNISPLPHIV